MGNMKYATALIFCLCSVIISYGYPQGHPVNHYRHPSHVQQSWNQQQQPVKYCNNPVNSMNTQFLDDIFAAGIEALLNPKNAPLNRQMRDDSHTAEVKPSHHHHKVKGSSLKHKPKALKHIEEGDNEQPHDTANFKGALKQSSLNLDSTYEIQNSPKFTRASPVNKFENKDGAVEYPKTKQEEDFMQTYRLLYKLLQADPLFGLGYDTLLKLIPTNVGSVSSLGKDVGSTPKVTRESHDDESESNTEKEERDIHDTKLSNVESDDLRVDSTDAYSDSTNQADATKMSRDTNQSDETL